MRMALSVVVLSLILAAKVTGAEPALAELSAEKLTADGFVSLFNGETWKAWSHEPQLDGWWEIGLTTCQPWQTPSRRPFEHWGGRCK
jgi:hypothetical protein